MPSKFAACVASLCILVFTGCVSKVSLAPSESGPVKPVFDQGIAILKSQKTHTVVVRVLTPQFSSETYDQPAFYVGVFNGGDAAFDLSPANVSATSGGSPVQVYTFEALEKRIRREAALMALAVAMNSASQSVAASAPKTTYTSGTVNSYGSGGYASANYSGYSTTYNPAATAAAQAQIHANSMAQMSMVASARDADLEGIESVLRRTTIAPGSSAGGVVKLKSSHLKSRKPLLLTVTIGGESHEFEFVVGQ